MKNAKKVGIAIVQIVIAGIAVFVAIQICHGDKQKDVDVDKAAVEKVEETPVPSETATSDFETNAGGYGEETLEQTEDGSFKDPDIDHQDENNITSEPAIEGHDTETTDNQVPHKEGYVDVEADDEGDFESYEADLPTEEQSREFWDLVEQNGTVLH